MQISFHSAYYSPLKNIDFCFEPFVILFCYTFSVLMFSKPTILFYFLIIPFLHNAIPSIVSIGSSYVGAATPFSLGMLNCLPRLARTLNFRLICLSKLLLLFVLGMKIARLFYKLFLSIGLFHIFLYKKVITLI